MTTISDLISHGLLKVADTLVWKRSWTSVTYESTTVGSPGSPETATAIGWGYWNTRAIILQGNTDTASSAVALADSYVSDSDLIELQDWFLPSRD